jgi:hypothetical protein
MAAGEILISARSLADYRLMFNLTDDDLRGGPILDCPAGAGTFAVEARARGGVVVSADPLYAAPLAEVGARSGASITRTLEYEQANPALFVFPQSAEVTIAGWQLSQRHFLADAGTHPGWYLAASLPALPFRNRAFRLGLSGYLLFTYPEFFGYPVLLASIVELTRVAVEARIYPLVDRSSTSYPAFDRLRHELAERGITTKIQPTPEYQRRGATAVMVCRSGGA